MTTAFEYKYGPVIGIGDSNLRMDDFGWQGSFNELNCSGVEALVSAPGKSSEFMRTVVNLNQNEIAHRLSRYKKVTVVVTTGINDVLQGVSASEFAQNHIDIMKIIDRVTPDTEIKWVWMPSHPTGQWKLEWLRLWLRWTAWCHGVKFVNLLDKEYREMIRRRTPGDRYHLAKESYASIGWRVRIREGF